MNRTVYKIFEYAYLVMFFFSLYLVYSNWELNRGRAYIFIFFAIVAILMFFFKRNFRKKMEERNNPK